MKINHSSILDTKVLATYIDGEKKFSQEGW